jgi:hypothetical protein
VIIAELAAKGGSVKMHGLDVEATEWQLVWWLEDVTVNRSNIPLVTAGKVGDRFRKPWCQLCISFVSLMSGLHLVQFALILRLVKFPSMMSLKPPIQVVCAGVYTWCSLGVWFFFSRGR